MVSFTILPGSYHVKRLGKVLMQQVEFGWTEVGGDFIADAGNNYFIV